MPFTVTRSNIRVNPNHKKVIPRFLNTGNERSLLILDKIIQMSSKEVNHLLSKVLISFSDRYRNIQAIFIRHYNFTKYLLSDAVQQDLSEEKKLLIGSFFTMEYAIEAAALFNPSIIEDPDQAGVSVGEKKVIVSFRATGENHISSLVFKRGILNADSGIEFEPSGKFFSEGKVTEQHRDSKVAFENILSQMDLPEGTIPRILTQLKDPFSYKEIELVMKDVTAHIPSAAERNRLRYDILSRVNTSYELDFSPGSSLSERVIFPVIRSEKNGIEDARFVKFTDDDGLVNYIATYTAYDGALILPQLILTTDFCHFKIRPLHGRAAINKNLALFPRKINGRYAMLSRIDGMNNYIMFSNDLYIWETASILQKPEYPWEFIQVGNAGSPIETEKGWLVITHGVGPMRKYCLGASLFDLHDPTVQLGRLKEPLLMPNEDEREGYVPNVVYSCGSMIHGENLVIPYAVSDYASSFATVPLNDLLEEILVHN